MSAAHVTPAQPEQADRLKPGKTVVVVCPGHAYEGREGMILGGMPFARHGFYRVMFADGYIGFFTPTDLAVATGTAAAEGSPR